MNTTKLYVNHIVTRPKDKRDPSKGVWAYLLVGSPTHAIKPNFSLEFRVKDEQVQQWTQVWAKHLQLNQQAEQEGKAPMNLVLTGDFVFGEPKVTVALNKHGVPTEYTSQLVASENAKLGREPRVGGSSVDFGDLF